MSSSPYNIFLCSVFARLLWKAKKSTRWFKSHYAPVTTQMYYSRQTCGYILKGTSHVHALLWRTRHDRHTGRACAHGRLDNFALSTILRTVHRECWIILIQHNAIHIQHCSSLGIQMRFNALRGLFDYYVSSFGLIHLFSRSQVCELIRNSLVYRIQMNRRPPRPLYTWWRRKILQSKVAY